MRRIRPSETVQVNFRRLLPRLLHRYFRRGRALAAETNATSESLHRFRIRTKRIRYITELYAEIFEQQLKAALEQFRNIQQVLGAHQDQAMISDYFGRRLERVKSRAFKREYRRLLARARRRQDILRRAFLRRWRRLEETRFEQRLVQRIKQDT